MRWYERAGQRVFWEAGGRGRHHPLPCTHPPSTPLSSLPGDVFALYEAVTALAVLARRFSYEIDPAAPAVGMMTGATIHTSGGLLLRLTRRQHGEMGVGEAAAAAPAVAA